MKKILVTGADGFIGSHLAEELVRRGYPVRALVQYNAFNSCGWLDHVNPAVRTNVEIIAGDIRDPFAMRNLVQGCDSVLHLAALIAIPYSYIAPECYVSTNIQGTLNLLQAARDAGVSRFVHTSTSEVYGTARFVPITEEHPLQSQSPYSASKIAADCMALSFQKSFGLPVSVIRPFNTYGPRQSARAVIPSIITQIAHGSVAIRLGAITPTRDFNFVRDTVAGFIAMMSSDTVLGKVVNVSSNYEVSIGDAARVIAEIMGADVNILDNEAERLRPVNSEVERLWGDNSLASELLNWRPAYGGLDGFRRGLAETVAWFSDTANLALYKSNRYVI
jgi:NAD dependent epimerase/dehydratase